MIVNDLWSSSANQLSYRYHHPLPQQVRAFALRLRDYTSFKLDEIWDLHVSVLFYHKGLVKHTVEDCIIPTTL